MSISKQPINLSDYYKSLNNGSIIINDYDYWNEEDNEFVRGEIATKFQGDTISLIPVCRCGETKGKYLEGTFCTECGTAITDVFSSHDPQMWFRRIDGMQKFLNPDIYSTIKRKLKLGTDILRWVGDSNYNPNIVKDEYILEHLRNIPNFKRTFTYSINNIDKILILLATILPKASRKGIALMEILDVIKANKHQMFSDHLPLLNKKMLVLEATNTGKFISVGLTESYDAVLSFMKNAGSDKTHVKERAMARINSLMADVYASNLKNIIGGKPGIARKHLHSSKLIFSARAVCIPQIGPHSYDEVFLPYSLSTVIFRPHILNLLLKKGYGYSEANRKLFKCVQYFDEEVYEILESLIKNSRDGFIPINYHRNPSLLIGSSLKLKLTHIKKDPLDKTTNISILIAKLPNLDFDGKFNELYVYKCNMNYYIIYFITIISLLCV